jgi:hypothetical protein
MKNFGLVLLVGVLVAAFVLLVNANQGAGSTPRQKGIVTVIPAPPTRTPLRGYHAQ